jgi:prepilin-type N-terminal cleavage/methylation domain-containing protein
MKRAQRGMTLLEVMVASSIFAFCLSGLLLTYINLFTLTDLTKDFTIAANAMQTKMEEIKRLPFINLASLNNTTFPVEGFTGTNATGVIQVLSNTGYTDLLQVRLVVSFKSKNRIIGEDANLDGVLNASEEAAGAGKLQLTTLIANFN